ncbi:hypothetical protein B3286c1_2071 [Brucella vulpis]|uniref:hypothetical protein n=1 Tax=Brucella vulpis TaxID=981386 RepID=UPI00073A7DA2|nr:hypothetical protein BF3285c1_2072 [Brucella vulpis]CUW50867.1 hypothetical protein B3286c1_2071 [Brucella vulpis]
MKNPSIFGSSQKRGVLIPICSRFESVTFRESEAILTLPEVCQQSDALSMRKGRFCLSPFQVMTRELLLVHRAKTA